MKNGQKKGGGIVKGTGRAFVISLLVHAGLFMLAGMLVVFTVVKRKEVEFEPPKAVERPKMQLKKPKVRVKKSSRPKSATRITTTVNRDTMPSLQLPEMSGIGDGLGDGGGVGGFDIMPSLDGISILGSGQSIGNDFKGTFYQFNRNRAGTYIPHSSGEYVDAIRRFIKHGWKPSILQKYYRSPNTIYSTMFVVPTAYSVVAPQAFGENDAEGTYWLLHYTGQIVYPEDITFRFVGQADSTIVVRIDGEIVFASVWKSDEFLSDIWSSSSADDRKWWMGNWTANVGDWVTLKAGQSYDMEVVLGDGGGLCCLMLAIQEKGVEYEIRPGGGPRLPAFKTAEPSHELQDLIYRDMVPGEICLTNGPVFNDYQPAQNEASVSTGPVGTEGEEDSETAEQAAEPADAGPRTWIRSDGSSFEAEYMACVGGKLVAKNARGKQIKIPVADLSDGDREFIELRNPPVLSVSAGSKSSSVYGIENRTKKEVIGYDHIYTARIRQTSSGLYEHELSAEFYAIGVQRFADTYILLDRQESSFFLSEENGKSHEFSGNKVHLRCIEPRFWENADYTVRGEKEYGYLLLVKDKRGEIIAHKSTAKWLMENYDSLKQLPVGAYLNKSAERVYAAGPPRARY